VAVLALAGLGGGLARVVTSLYAVAIRCTQAELGLVAAARSLALVVVSLPSGALVRRWGPGRPFVLGSVLGGVATAAVPLLPRPWFFVACVAALGACMALRIVPMNVATMRRIDAEGDARAGWYRAITLLGMFVVGPSLAAASVAALGFPAAWWGVAAVFLLPACVARGALGVARPSSDPARRLGFRLAAADPEAQQLAATELAAQGTSSFFSFFVIPLAIRRLGLDATAAAGLVSAHAAAFILALLTMGGVAARWGRGRVARAAHGSAAVGLLLLGLARGGGSLYAGSVLLGAGLGLVQMTNLVRATRVGARVGRGAASGLQTFSGSAGGLLAGALGGVLDAQAVFLSVAPLFAWLASRERAAAVSSPLREDPAARGSAPSRSPASSCGP